MITLSHSTIDLFNMCERKYQHKKILRSEVEFIKSPALVNGSAVDDGYAVYLQTRNVEQAILTTFAKYHPVLTNKSCNQFRAVLAIEALAEATPPDWKLFELESGKPATQLAFKINIDDTYCYIGFVDAICVDGIGKIIPVELKTTSGYATLDAMFGNSTQALVYAFIIFAATGKLPTDISYEYIVARMPVKVGLAPYIERKTFHKTANDLLQWLITLKLDIERMEGLKELDFYPKRNNCNAFGRECEFLGICDMTTSMAGSDAKPSYRDGIDFDFEFDLDYLIDLVSKEV